MNKPIYEGLTLNQLAERNAEHVTAIGRLEAQVKQLAAENAALKAACGGDGSYRNCPACTFSEYIEAPETPATDAYAASLRAEGVEMLVEHCKKSALVKSYDFWMDASACAESFAAHLRSKSEVQS